MRVSRTPAFLLACAAAGALGPACARLVGIEDARLDGSGGSSSASVSSVASSTASATSASTTSATSTTSAASTSASSSGGGGPLCVAAPCNTGLTGQCAAGTTTCTANPGSGICARNSVPCNLWAKQLGDSAEQRGYAIAASAIGNVAITGRFQGTIDFGGGPLTDPGQPTPGNGNLFVASFDATGAPLWSAGFGDAYQQEGDGIAIDSSGNVIVVGTFEGKLDFGAVVLTTTGTQFDSDSFIAKFSPAGALLWATRYGDAMHGEYLTGVAIDANDDIFVVGTEQSYQINSPIALVTAKYAKDCGAGCSPSWIDKFVEPANMYAIGAHVAAGPLGTIVIGGHFGGTVDFGGHQAVAAGQDAFVAELDSQGGVSWVKSWGDAADQSIDSVAVDAASNIVASGTNAGFVNYAGSILKAPLIVLKMDGNGNETWGKDFGMNSASATLALDANGAALLSGTANNVLDLGCGAFNGAGGFLAKLEPDGSCAFSQPIWAGMIAVPRVKNAALFALSDVWNAGNVDVGVAGFLP